MLQNVTLLWSSERLDESEISWHQSHSLGVKGAQVGVGHKRHHVCLRGFLQALNGRLLPPELQPVTMAYSQHLPHHTGKRRSPDEQVAALLVARNLLQDLGTAGPLFPRCCLLATLGAWLSLHALKGRGRGGGEWRAGNYTLMQTTLFVKYDRVQNKLQIVVQVLKHPQKSRQSFSSTAKKIPAPTHSRSLHHTRPPNQRAATKFKKYLLGSSLRLRHFDSRSPPIFSIMGRGIMHYEATPTRTCTYMYGK